MAEEIDDYVSQIAVILFGGVSQKDFVGGTSSISLTVVLVSRWDRDGTGVTD
jgi:hypothetical protein